MRHFLTFIVLKTYSLRHIKCCGKKIKELSSAKTLRSNVTCQWSKLRQPSRIFHSFSRSLFSFIQVHELSFVSFFLLKKIISLPILCEFFLVLAQISHHGKDYLLIPLINRINFIKMQSFAEKMAGFMARPNQDAIPKDDIPWYFKYAARILGVVAAFCK